MKVWLTVDVLYASEHVNLAQLLGLLMQGSAHTGQEWSGVVSPNHHSASKLFLPPLTESNSTEMLYLIIKFQLKLSHHSDHPGQNPATV